MSNSYFSFKQFTVQQDLCAMKVGTDGTLLGAWARGGRRILDIGTGTGLIALMMSQRFPTSQVVGIDMDAPACRQAEENVLASPFADRISINHVVLQDYQNEPFDAIVCNPPFFVDSLKSPDLRRTTARHASSLSYHDLFQGVTRLLCETGEFSVIIPVECRHLFDVEAVLSGLHLWREWAVKTTERKSPKRYLLSYGRTPATTYERQMLVMESEKYREMMKDFYLS